MKTIDIRVRTLPHFAGLELPAYASAHAAGMDVRAAVDADLPVAPGARALVPTGLAVAIPPGYEIQVRPRSGLAIRQGAVLLNSPGTIDADYRGEIKVILANLGEEDLLVGRGMRIAQLVVAAVPRARLRVVDELDGTERGEGGFGSTGR